MLGWMTDVGSAKCKEKVKDVAWVGSFAVVWFAVEVVWIAAL